MCLLASGCPCAVSIILMPSCLCWHPCWWFSYSERVWSKRTSYNNHKATGPFRKSDPWLDQDSWRPLRLPHVQCVDTCGKCCAMCVWPDGAARGKKAGVHTGKLGSRPELPQTDWMTTKMDKSLKSTERQSLKWESKDKTWSPPKFNRSQWSVEERTNQLGNQRRGFSPQLCQTLSFQSWVFGVPPLNLSFLSNSMT